MIRLHFHVEGQTEEGFVRDVLAPHLWSFGVYSTVTIAGGGPWGGWQRDLRRLVGDGGADARFTTLFDLYGLPRDFPGLAEHAAQRNTEIRVDLLQQAMRDAVGDRRFIPYLQRHEFEALVLAGLDDLERLLDPEDRDGARSLRSSIGNMRPEDVDDGKETAPSKRILASIPSYQKTVHGPLVTACAGLSRLRAACPRFDRWVSTLEGLSSSTTTA